MLGWDRLLGTGVMKLNFGHHGSDNALCGYPHVKVSIRELNQISTTAPIFQQYDYFRQNSEENVTFTFYFFSFASNFPCKIL